MKNLTLFHIAEICGGCLYSEEKNITDELQNREAAGVVLDSRKVEKDYIFIATKGERVDGHDFITQVFEKGALGVVCEQKPENAKGPYIIVKDSFQALKEIAEYYRMQLAVKVVGISGSVGKTSTKEFVASVLSTKYNVLKTEGNFNNEVGLPLTILKIRQEHEVAVLEMGISDFGEMHRLSKMAKPDICILTNIGQCHLENLKSREGILKAKTEMFDFMSKDGFVCLNGDDDMLVTVEEVYGKRPFYFGKNEKNRVFADEIVNKGLLGSRANIHIEDECFMADIPLPGEHMVDNALAACCVGSLLFLSLEEMKKGIANVKPVDGRSHILSVKDKVVIDDCYNANPVSMCAALDLLATAPTRKAAILGDMFELGEQEDVMHARVGAYAVEKKIDVIICIGKLSKNMYEGARKEADGENLSKQDIYYFEEKQDFLNEMERILEKEDTILVKASHGMEFGIILDALKGLD